MKSVIAQGSTVAKAIEEALKKSDSPQEFFVKILEDAQSGFLGFGAKKAKIALFFKNGDASERTSSGAFQKGSYSELFNNPSIKKQIDHQLKESGIEVKSVKQETVEKKNSSEQSRYSNMQVRPLQPKSSQQPRQQQNQPKSDESASSFQEETLQQYVSKQFNSSSDSVDQKRDENRSNPNRRRRYYRFRRNNNRNRNDQQQDRESHSSGDIDNSKKDE